MKRTNKIVVGIWLLLSLLVLTVVDSRLGGLRFADRGVTILVGFAALWLPVVCVVLLGFLPRSRARLWAFIGLIPAALLCLVLGSIVVLSQVVTMRTRQASVRLGGSRIVTYFSDAGGLDTGEVVVQQEVSLAPGLLWVKPLSSKECLRDVHVIVLDRHHVRCDYVADRADALDPAPEAQRDDAWVF